MKKILLLVVLIHPVMHAMQMDDNNTADLRLRLLKAEREISELKETVTKHTLIIGEHAGKNIEHDDKIHATQLTVSSVTGVACCCMTLWISMLNEKIDAMAHKCK